MSRVDPETLDREDRERVFLTPSLFEARRVEELLTRSGVDYAVLVEPCGTSLFGSPRNGAAFYVASGQATYCRAQLTAAGLELGVALGEGPAPSS